uniref:Uncharacterized protein n=1 Tax=Picea glauca TaxID=3330 RepID=A0A101M1L2_PICGL|nr:hypothetical protein ABT39_MTgene3803 [Picea glauca]QHR87512.1 hypothetical protein Q903MT_gene1523 [Picea sitchensis]
MLDFSFITLRVIVGMVPFGPRIMHREGGRMGKMATFLGPYCWALWLLFFRILSKDAICL